MGLIFDVGLALFNDRMDPLKDRGYLKVIGLIADPISLSINIIFLVELQQHCGNALMQTVYELFSMSGQYLTWGPGYICALLSLCMSIPIWTSNIIVPVPTAEQRAVIQA